MRSLWDFSLDIYARDGVAEACLALQQRHALDVNLLLYACWAGTAGVEIGAAEASAAIELSARWSAETVQRLRAARMWMKADNAVRARNGDADYGRLRNGIKALELEAERLQQIALASLIVPDDGAPADAETRAALMGANLRRYVEAAGTRIDDGVSGQLATLLAAASRTSVAAAHKVLESAGRSAP